MDAVPFFDAILTTAHLLTEQLARLSNHLLIFQHQRKGLSIALNYPNSTSVRSKKENLQSARPTPTLVGNKIRALRRCRGQRPNPPLTRGTQDPNTTSRVIPESGAITEYPEFERPDYSRHHNKQVRDLHSLWTLQVSLVHRRVRITYSPSRAPMRKHAPAVKTCPHSTRSLDPYSPARSEATS